MAESPPNSRYRRSSVNGWPSLETSAKAPPQRTHANRRMSRTPNKKKQTNEVREAEESKSTSPAKTTKTTKSAPKQDEQPEVVTKTEEKTEEKEPSTTNPTPTPQPQQQATNTGKKSKGSGKKRRSKKKKKSGKKNKGQHRTDEKNQNEDDNLTEQVVKLDFNNCTHKDVVEAFTYWNTEFPDVAIAVAAIKALTWVAQNSAATTIMEFQEELKKAIHRLTTQTSIAAHRSGIALRASCELFNRYVTRASFDVPDFNECKRRLVERGLAFAERSLNCRREIMQLGKKFIRDGKVILVHGCSRVVNQILIKAAEDGKRFRVVVTEGREGDGAGEGYQVAKTLSAAGIPVTLVLDAAAGYIMESVDIVLMGAAAVAENGGVVNKVGSYQVAMIASTLQKPVYVAAESYKFARLFLLNQDDLNKEQGSDETAKPHPALMKKLPHDSNYIKVESNTSDYTPPQFITLLFTDIGILTPSAVSDQLIKLYQ